jgi:endonuclease III-like uncharacterized protein
MEDAAQSAPDEVPCRENISPTESGEAAAPDARLACRGVRPSELVACSKTPFEVILGAYLTQNTAWKAVERSLANLRRRER